MNIIWHGQSCFSIATQKQNKKEGKTSLLIDPFNESMGIKPPKTEADIIFVTHSNKYNNIKINKKETFVIDSAGEYELKNIFIQGIYSHCNQFSEKDKKDKKGINTIYVIEAEGMKICHLGAISQKELAPSQLKEIGEIDLLMIPVGGEQTIGAKEATQLISQIEPRIVIPMYYKIPGLKVDLDDVEPFLKAMGEKQEETQDKLVLQQKDLPVSEMKIITLKTQ